jgi:adenylate cyclase
VNPRLTGVLIGLASALLLLLLALLDPSLFGVEWLYYDQMARMVARRHRPDPGILIVSLNEKSIRTLEPFYGRPPYSREVMALVTEEARQGGARLVVFDFVFSEENLADPEGDRALAAALQNSNSVLAVVTQEAAGMTPPHSYRDKLWQVEDFRADRPVLKLTPPIPMFAGATAIGTIRLNVTQQRGVNREYSLIDRVEQKLYVPTLALAAAATDQGLPRQARLGRSAFQAGPLRIAVTPEGTFFIRWKGAKKNPLDLSYAYVDFDKVVSAALARRDPESSPYSPEELDAFSRMTFENRIALVGFTATGAASDLRATPLSPAGAGIEIHANALDNLLQGDFNRLVPMFPMAILLLLVTSLAGLLLHPMRSPLLASLLAGGIILLWLVAGYLMLEQGWILRAVTPAAAILVTFVASTTLNVIAEQRQTLRLRATFGHYVSPQVLDYLLSDPARVQLSGERRELTILFSDIRGFTSISEASEPETVVEMLNEYLTRMVDILLEHGGTLDKFIGDAVMGFWNAPTVDPEHARHAVQCAMEMIDQTARLREKWTAEGKPGIRIGIGINTGEAVVGNIGSRQVFGYTVIGDAVNLASRLEGTNKEYGTEIIISETTRAQMGSDIETAFLGEVKVKGKERAVRIHEVKGKTK